MRLSIVTDTVVVVVVVVATVSGIVPTTHALNIEINYYFYKYIPIEC